MNPITGERPEAGYDVDEESMLASQARDMYFDFGLSKSVGKIPWNEFEEVEIQGILRQYYASLGYKVDWSHTAKRSEKFEMNFDLICAKDGKTTAIIVKKSLTLEDLKDFQKTDSMNYNEKICILVNPVSLSLMGKMDSFDRKLKIVDMADIERKMRSSDEGSQILCGVYYSNSEFVIEAIKFVFQIHRIAEEKKEDESDINKPMPKLWQLKDYAVTMEKSLESLLNLMDNSAFYAKASREQVMNVFMQGLGIITHCMFGFNRIWKELLKENKSLVKQTYAKYGSRSNWLGIWTYGNYIIRADDYSPGVLKDKMMTLEPINKEMYDEDERKFASMSKIHGGRTYVPTPLFANFVREDFLRPHFGFALSLENTVDQMFEL